MKKECNVCIYETAINKKYKRDLVGTVHSLTLDKYVNIDQVRV